MGYGGTTPHRAAPPRDGERRRDRRVGRVPSTHSPSSPVRPTGHQQPTHRKGKDNAHVTRMLHITTVTKPELVIRDYVPKADGDLMIMKLLALKSTQAVSVPEGDIEAAFNSHGQRVPLGYHVTHTGFLPAVNSQLGLMIQAFRPDLRNVRVVSRRVSGYVLFSLEGMDYVA